MKKIIDTNILLDYPEILNQDNIIVSIYTIYELDKLKNSSDISLAQKAREATRQLKKNLNSIEIDRSYVSSKPTDEGLLDIAIIRKSILVTNDLNLQIRAESLEIEWEEYYPIEDDFQNLCYKKIILNNEEMANFYNGKYCDFNLFENQYLLICNTDEEVVDTYIYKKGSLKKLQYSAIDNIYMGMIKPKNIEQQLAFNLVEDRDIKVKLIRGTYGSGKDYIMLGKALELLEKGKFKKIIYVRPNVEVNDGNIYEKLSWTLGPIADKIGGEEIIKMLINRGQFEIVPLSYIRGRSFEDSLIYCSEGQNMTVELVKLVLGRVGEGSELWINGDTHQTDNKIFDKDNGLISMIKILKGNPLFGYVFLSKSERSEVANLCELFEKSN